MKPQKTFQFHASLATGKFCGAPLTHVVAASESASSYVRTAAFWYPELDVAGSSQGEIQGERELDDTGRRIMEAEVTIADLMGKITKDKEAWEVGMATDAVEIKSTDGK